MAVQIVQRFVLARLRNRRFFSLYELNAAIRETVADLNAKIDAPARRQQRRAVCRDRSLLSGLLYTIDPANHAIAIIVPRSNRVLALI